MTYEEAYRISERLTFKTSEGQDCQQIANAIWKSNEEKYMKCLFALNKRTDWYDIAPGVELRYLSNYYLDNVNEV